MPQSHQPLYLADLLTGIFAALAERDVKVLSLRETALDRALEKLYPEMERVAGEYGLKPRFRIRLHPIHGDSPTVHQELREARKRDLVSSDNPEFVEIRSKLLRGEAAAYFAELPGDAHMYRQLADRLLVVYREVAQGS